MALGLSTERVLCQSGGCNHRPANQLVASEQGTTMLTEELDSSWPLPVLGPQWLEVDCQADRSASVHLGGLAIQLWNLDLWRSCWVGCGDVELVLELILEEVVYVPTGA